MMVPLLIAVGFASAPDVDTRDTFACSWIATEDDDPFFLDVVELVAERTRSATGESWTLEWEEGDAVVARPFPLEAGQFGERIGLEWMDDSGVKQAFVSYLPDYAVGQEMMLIKLDAAFPEQPPGFVCLTAPLEEATQ